MSYPQENRINCIEVACHQLRSTGNSKALYQNEESRRSRALCGFLEPGGETCWKSHPENWTSLEPYSSNWRRYVTYSQNPATKIFGKLSV